jgi:carboxylesterase
MPQPAHLDPSAYSAGGGPWGVLLIHGFTGSVAETRPMGEYLAARGLTVRCPLLPGHGTTPLHLTRIRWQAWAETVESALDELQHRCQSVFVGGLSLGALLTLWLGARRPEIAGLIVMASAIKIRDRRMPLALGLRYVLKYNPKGSKGDSDLGDPQAVDRIWCYDETPVWGASEVYLLQRRVRKLLPRIGQPVLIFQGRRDKQLDLRGAQITYDKVASTDKTLVWLENSGHNVLADGEREALWAQSYDWMLARLPAATMIGGVGQPSD